MAERRRWVWERDYPDALPELLRNRDNNTFPGGQCFDNKLAEWTKELKAMLSSMEVQQEVVANIRFHPCANEPRDLLPNGKPWLAPLSLTIMEMLSPEKKAAFSQEHNALLRNVTELAEQPPPLSPFIGVELTVTSFSDQITEASRESSLQASTSSLLSESQEIRAALSKLRKTCNEFVILVVGRTGVGKSTLINNLLGQKVASVGHTLQSETPTVQPHKYTVEGVPITVYDTPGLGDIKGEEAEEKNLDTIKGFLAQNEIHLVVYCVQMNETIMTSSLVGTLHKYRQIGVDWKRSVIALTFADALYVPKSEQPNLKQLNKYFDGKMDSWQKELNTALSARSAGVVEQRRVCSCFQRLLCRHRRGTDEHDTVGVDSNTLKQLKIYPTSLLPTDQLPNGKPWYVPFWLHISEILSPAATVRLLDIRSKDICDDHTPPLNCGGTANSEFIVRLTKEDGNRLSATLVATVNAAREDGSEESHAHLVTALKSGVHAIQMYFTPEPTYQSGNEHVANQDIFKSFGDRFVKEAHSKDNLAFIWKLYRHCVIPESVKTEIERANDGATANELLFEHLCKQGKCETWSKLVVAMIEAEGYPTMNGLGRDMQSALGLSAPSSMIQQETAV